MGVQNTWLLENWIGYFLLDGQLTLEDIKRWFQISVEMDVTVPEGRLVHTVVNLSRLDGLPKLSELTNKDLWKRPQRHGWLIFVMGDNAGVKFPAGVIAQVMDLRHRFFDTFEDGLAFLQKNDSGLPDISMLKPPF